VQGEFVGDHVLLYRVKTGLDSNDCMLRQGYAIRRRAPITPMTSESLHNLRQRQIHMTTQRQTTLS
jgi:hypothetical protein